jgi:UDP-N-acetylglucosamine--N-acetylmuramyl-(pentapeptide) pyrophosphoryl-undecaprenol N-acetylglucosamine transferase
MSRRNIIFAGGGTGGHIYPAIAVAEKILQIETDVKILFYCSRRSIDSQILSKAGLDYKPLPAVGLKLSINGIIDFYSGFRQSERIVKEDLHGLVDTVIVGVGGFVSAPVCRAGYKLKIPVFTINTDTIPGKANKYTAKFADKIFVQFEESRRYFKQADKVEVTGCPVRRSFENPRPDEVRRRFGLDEKKKTLLITGASSGAVSINRTVCSLLGKLEKYADKWQIVHLTGKNNYNEVKSKYKDIKIKHCLLDYYAEMADLLSVADLVIGRSGAVSVAEFAISGTPSICMPYPHHKDLHQYRNAGKLVEVGSAVIVDDLPDEKERKEWLWEELSELLEDDEKLKQMSENCRKISHTNAALKIAEKILNP